jgi:PAS domain S-box-containing protein
MNPLDFTHLAEALFEEAGDALFLFDPDSDEILAVNSTALRLSGFTKKDLSRQPVTWLYRFDGRSSQHRLRRASQQSGVFHNQDGFELRTRDDGVWIPVNLTITRLHVQPKTLALITARDVREQRDAHDRVKKVEAELRRVLASVSDCLWSAEIDATGQWTYRYVSPVVEKITGRPVSFFTSGAKHWWSIVAPEDRPCCERATGRWRRGEPSQEEYRVIRPDGTARWVRDSVQASAGTTGGMGIGIRLDGVLTDVTERRQAEEILKQTIASEREAHHKLKLAQSQLVASEKLVGLGQLVAGVAHEINNPLAFVSNNTVVLQRDLASLRQLLDLYRSADGLLAQHVPELHGRIAGLCKEIDLEYTATNIDGLLARSREGLQRIQQIVKGLRDFARLDESDLKEADLNAGIESTINILRGEAKKKHVTLVLDLAPGLAEVACYPARINQVVMNLVANAIYACGESGEVTVRTRPAPDGVAIDVIDNGAGIDPDVLPRIFDPFFTTKPVGQGTGLGLSISHQIVEDHGGRMEVQSVPGQGAHFIVYLPLHAAPKKKS